MDTNPQKSEKQFTHGFRSSTDKTRLTEHKVFQRTLQSAADQTLSSATSLQMLKKRPTI